MLAPLAEAVSALARAPFWQFDIKQHTGRVSSIAFAPASVPGKGATKPLLHSSLHLYVFCYHRRDNWQQLIVTAMQQWVLIWLRC